jgi:predicted permease
MADFVQDLRFALRQLRTSPGFTFTAVLTLALGIGANTAVFSALNALLLKMLPVRDPHQLYTVVLVNGGTQPPNTSGTGHGNTSFSYPVFRELRSQTRILTELIAHVPLGFGAVPVRYGNVAIEKAGEGVSGNYFSGLGVPMLRGRGFNQDDERNHNAVVVLSYSFWTQEFSRAPEVVGKTLYIKGVPFSVAGVTPPAFFGVDPAKAVDFWVPLQIRPELNAWGAPAEHGTLYGSPKWWALPMVARLAPGVTPEQAQQSLHPIFWQAASEGLGALDAKEWPARLGFEPIRGIAGYTRNYRLPVEIMMALVGLILLIACTNVALLILARNAARQREFAVRIAIGAGAARLFRQLLAESLLLVAGGAAAGWALAIGATRVLAVWAKIDTGLAPDSRVLLFTLAVASLAALVFGLAPLRSALSFSVERALKSSAQGATQDRRQVSRGSAAIALQVAMCLTLLVASGLTVRSLLNYEHQDLGMRADRLLVFDVSPQNIKDEPQAISFYRRLLERVKAIPGVEAASLVHTRPGSGWLSSGGITVDGVDFRSDARPHVSVSSNQVGPDFFATMGIQVLQGRDVSDADRPAAPNVAWVNEDFAKRFLNHGALGHRLGDHPGTEIVGVVKDSKYRSVTESNMPTVYYPSYQAGLRGSNTIEVRAAGDALALLPEVRRVLHDLDPEMPLQKPNTQAAQFDESYVTPRLFARLATCFGVLAVVLVATGLYGTLVYRVQRRRNEIGVRMALGAGRAGVSLMVLRESLAVTAVGVVVGLPLSLAIAHLLRSQLYQLSYLDPGSFASAVAMTLVVAVSAAILPARKASSINPMEALRCE